MKWNKFGSAKKPGLLSRKNRRSLEDEIKRRNENIGQNIEDIKEDDYA